MSKICNTCKVERNEDFFVSKIGRILKTCKRCRELRYQKTLCQHGRSKSKCKECGGSQICEHSRVKSQCKECCGGHICEHKNYKSRCKECCGSQICEHRKVKSKCKECGNVKKITIKNMVYGSKHSDIKYKRYDANNFIDYCFVEMLIDESMACFHCKKTMQLVEFTETLCTIERLNNQIGHSKANCVLACKKCNCSKAGQKKAN